MPLNRKRPPVSIQVPDVPAAAYGISACGTFSEGNLEISRSGMRIAGRRGSCEDLRTVPSGDLSTQDGRFEKTPNGSLTGDRTHTPVSNDGHSSQRSEGGVNAETTNATAAYQHHTVGDSDEFSADTNPVSDLNAASDSIASLNTKPLLWKSNKYLSLTPTYVINLIFFILLIFVIVKITNNSNNF